MLVTYFGHSALQIELNSVIVLVDPFITGNGLAEKVVSADDLNPDVLLLTHAHGDHWGDAPAIIKRAKPLVVANHEIVTYVGRELEYNKSHGMNSGGKYDFAWGTLHQTRAEHSSSFPDGTYGGHPNGFILEAEGKTVYLMGDTAPFAEMAWIGEDHNIDVAFMPIGDNFTMGPAGSLRAARMLRPGITVPVHYNTFPVIEIDTDGWARDMKSAGFEARVLAPGETLDV